MNTVSKYDVADVVKHISGSSETDNAGSGGINGIFGTILAEISQNSLESNAEGKVAEGGTELPPLVPAEPDSTLGRTPTVDQLVAHLNTRIFEERVSEPDFKVKNPTSESIDNGLNFNSEGAVVTRDISEKGGNRTRLSADNANDAMQAPDEELKTDVGVIKILAKADGFESYEMAPHIVNNRQHEFEIKSLSSIEKQKLTEAALSKNIEALPVTEKSYNERIDPKFLNFQKSVDFKDTNYIGIRSESERVKDESVRVEKLREKRPVILGPAKYLPASSDIRTELADQRDSENRTDGYSPLKRGIDDIDVSLLRNAEGAIPTARGAGQEDANLDAINQKNISLESNRDADELRLEKRFAEQVLNSKETKLDDLKISNNGVVKDSLKALSTPMPKPSEAEKLSSTVHTGIVGDRPFVEQLSNTKNLSSSEIAVKLNNYSSNKSIENQVSQSEHKPAEKNSIDTDKRQVTLDTGKRHADPGVAHIPVMRGNTKNKYFEQLSGQSKNRIDTVNLEKTTKRPVNETVSSYNTQEDRGSNSARPLVSVEGNQLANERNFSSGIASNIDVRGYEITEGINSKARTSSVPVSDFPAGMQAALKGHLSQTSAGNTKFTVSLFPENFGKIEVEVTFSEDAGLNVKMFSDNPEATKLLQQNISTLRENLAFEKVSELVIDSNREKSSDGNFADDSSQSQQLVDKDAESSLSEESSEEEKVDESGSSNMSEGLDTYV
jgi:hypothetical protein